MKIDASSATDVGLVRKTNQDAVGCFPEMSVFALADGMGGLEGGEVASRVAIEAVRGFFESAAAASGQTAPALIRAVELANDAVLLERERRSGGKESPTIGTTIVLLKLSPEASRAAWAHVGDSRLY